MKKVNLKIIKELDNGDVSISISEGEKTIELTYSCIFAFVNAIKKIKYEHIKKGNPQLLG